jgi:hypothetical protein
VNVICDFHTIFKDPVNHHEGKRWQGKFTCPFYAARPTLVRQRLQRTSTFLDCLGNALDGKRIFLPDVFDNLEKIFSGSRCPAELHLFAKHLIDAGADVFVRQEFPSIKLLQASPHLLAEPSVMVRVVSHELLQVLFRAALVFGSGPVHFRS